MASTGLTRAKAGFFDKAAVIKAIGKASADALSKSGNKLKVIAQRSMRYVEPFRKGGRPRIVSKPGEPPRAVRSHPLLRKFLYAIYDFATERAVIGPVKLSALPGEAPKVMEHGGRVRIVNKRRKNRRVGDVGEIRIGLGGRHSRLAQNTLMGTIPVTYAALKTPAQAARANKLNADLYGRPSKTVDIARRPYMGPALVKTAGVMTEMWRNSVRK